MAAATRSSSPAAPIPILSEDFKNRAINKSICDDVSPLVLQLVLEWGSDLPNKPDNQSFWDFIFEEILKNENSKTKKFWKGLWRGDTKTKLERTSIRDFDAQLLVQLITICCKDLAPHDDPAWKEDNNNGSLESLITRVRNIRNGIMHDPATTAVSSNTAHDLKHTFIRIINLAGAKYQRKQKEIDMSTNFIITAVENTSRSFGTNRETLVVQTRRLLRTDGVHDIKKLWAGAKRHVYLPLTNVAAPIKDIFHETILSEESENCDPPTEFPCSELLRRCKPSHPNGNVYVIVGSSGSGKTTLLKGISLDFLNQETSEKFKGIRNFDIQLFVEGKEPNLITIHDLVKKTFPSVLSEEHMPYVEECIEHLNTLILIDGIDDFNVNSSKLVGELIKRYRYSKSVIILASSRQYAAKIFSDNMLNNGIYVKHFIIKELGTLDEQLECIRRYEAAINSLCGLHIDRHFKELDEHSRSQLVQPLHLALYCSLILQSKSNKRRLNNEIDILQEILSLSRINMELKLAENNVQDPVATKVILDVLCKASLKCLVNDRMYLCEKDYENFCLKIYSKLKTYLNVNALLSCVLTAESNLYSSGQATYHFYHKSQLEYMAALAVLNSLKKKPTKTIQWHLKLLTGASVSDEHMRVKFKNVVRFVFMELDSTHQLRGYSSALLKSLLPYKNAYLYWAEMLGGSGNSEGIAQLMSSTIDVKHWKVKNVRECARAAFLLKYKQPLVLTVNINQSLVEDSRSQLPKLFEAIKTNFTGHLKLNLYHSFLNYIPMTGLQDMWGLRCKVSSVRTCIEASDCGSLTTLRNFNWTRDSTLSLSMPSIGKHSLCFLEDISPSHFSLHFRYSTISSNVRQLPLGEKYFLLQLSIEDIPQEQCVPLQQILIGLLPQSKRLKKLNLLNCSIDKLELQCVAKRLQIHGIRTVSVVFVDYGKTRAVKYKNSKAGKCVGCGKIHDSTSKAFCWNLIITDYQD